MNTTSTLTLNYHYNVIVHTLHEYTSIFIKYYKHNYSHELHHQDMFVLHN